MDNQDYSFCLTRDALKAEKTLKNKGEAKGQAKQTYNGRRNKHFL